jgi:hypothetical protein|tara:strand:+ start:131 stop:238 length:108 start_codon:yes stop_codon:yes gene_type:complete
MKALLNSLRGGSPLLLKRLLQQKMMAQTALIIKKA